MAIHIHFDRLVTHHTTRYIGVFIPLLIISSPSSTTVLEKYTTILYYAKTIGIPYSLPLCGHMRTLYAFPTALLYSAYALFDKIRLRCNAPQLYNGCVVDVAYCISLLYYYYVLYYINYYYYVCQCYYYRIALGYCYYYCLYYVYCKSSY